ncbi:hypothetical protein AB205_0039090, partial [Aquarana catesbeiana]
IVLYASKCSTIGRYCTIGINGAIHTAASRKESVHCIYRHTNKVGHSCMRGLTFLQILCLYSRARRTQGRRSTHSQSVVLQCKRSPADKRREQSEYEMSLPVCCFSVH